MIDLEALLQMLLGNGGKQPPSLSEEGGWSRANIPGSNVPGRSDAAGQSLRDILWQKYPQYMGAAGKIEQETYQKPAPSLEEMLLQEIARRRYNMEQINKRPL